MIIKRMVNECSSSVTDSSQGLYITVYIYTEYCVIMQVFVVLPQSASEATRIGIKYQLCVKKTSCGFNCKPDNKNRNPENL